MHIHVYCSCSSTHRPQFRSDRELDASLSTRERQHLVLETRDSNADARRQREGDWLDGRGVHVVHLPVTPVPATLAVSVRVQLSATQLIDEQSARETRVNFKFASINKRSSSPQLATAVVRAGDAVRIEHTAHV